MLAHRFYGPELRAYSTNKQWSYNAIKLCREFLMNMPCNVEIKGNLDHSIKQKIVPCNIIQTVKRMDLISFVKTNELYYDEEEDILFV